MFQLPILVFPRPLRVFGSAFRVEVSSALTLAPSTVLQAATGTTLLMLLRDAGTLAPLRQLAYALKGKHRLTATTRKTVLRHVGKFAVEVASVLDGDISLEDYVAESPWITLEEAVSIKSPDEFVGLIVAGMAGVDRQFLAGRASFIAGDKEAGVRSIAPYFGHSQQEEWRAFGNEIALMAAWYVETCIVVLAGAIRSASAALGLPSPQHRVVLDLLALGSKPIGHWMAQVCAAANCKSYSELHEKLLRDDVRYLGGRHISVDTLKAWSSMKPEMVMPLDAAEALLRIVPKTAQPERMLTQWGLARFLAFLCDFLCSSDVDGQVNWARAQFILHERYTAVAQRDATN